jgi:hypothetical protein
MELHTVCFRGNYRRNEIFFLFIFSVSKSTSNNFFIINELTAKQKSIDKRFIDGDFPSVISSVIILPMEW